jgi:hypothetical protein
MKGRIHILDGSNHRADFHFDPNKKVSGKMQMSGKQDFNQNVASEL